MARLIVKDVTLTKGEDILVQVRFKGGATKVLHVSKGKPAWQLRQTKKEVVAEIDRLLDKHTEGEIVGALNERGWRSGEGNAFTLRIVQSLRRNYQLTSRFERLRGRGLKTAEEIAQLIGSKSGLVKYWRQQGLLNGELLNEKLEYLYFRPSKAQIQQIQSRTRLENV